MATIASLTGMFAAVKQGLGKELEKAVDPSSRGSNATLNERGQTTSSPKEQEQSNSVLPLDPSAPPSHLPLSSEVKYYDFSKRFLSLLESEVQKHPSPPELEAELSKRLHESMESLVPLLLGVVNAKVEKKLISRYKEKIRALFDEGRRILEEAKKIPKDVPSNKEVKYNPIPRFSDNPFLGRDDSTTIIEDEILIKVTLFGFRERGTHLYLLGDQPIPPNLKYTVGKEVILREEQGASLSGIVQVEGDLLILAALALKMESHSEFPITLSYKGGL